MSDAIDVYDLLGDRVGLIIAAPSGVVWESQVGGMACDRAEMEGVLVPLRQRRGGQAIEQWIDQHRACMAPLSEADADALDAAFLADGVELRVDRDWLHDRPGDSTEAWVHVHLPDGRHGVFVYENCD